MFKIQIKDLQKLWDYGVCKKGISFETGGATKNKTKRQLATLAQISKCEKLVVNRKKGCGNQILCYCVRIFVFS